MIGEALDTLGVLLIAYGLWLIAAAVVATLLLLAVIAGLYGVWNGLKSLTQSRRSPRPSWALTRRHSRFYARRTRPDHDYDYEEAA